MAPTVILYYGLMFQSSMGKFWRAWFVYRSKTNVRNNPWLLGLNINEYWSFYELPFMIYLPSVSFISFYSYILSVYKFFLNLKKTYNIIMMLQILPYIVNRSVKPYHVYIYSFFLHFLLRFSNKYKSYFKKHFESISQNQKGFISGRNISLPFI